MPNEDRNAKAVLRSKRAGYGKIVQSVIATIGFALIVGLLIVIAIPGLKPDRTAAQQNACINNLRQIDSGKEQWALEYAKTNGQAVVTNEVHRYLKGNRGRECPSSGKYTYNVIGTEPSCSVHGTKENPRAGSAPE